MRGARAFVVLVSMAIVTAASLAAAAVQEGAAGAAIVPSAGQSAALLHTATPALRFGALALLLGGTAAAFWSLFRREVARGRAAPLLASSEIDAAWLEQHVFSMPAELVGAAVDRRVGWPEVAAVLARMTLESKLVSRVASGSRGWNNLELWLLTEREDLAGYERELVESLFRAKKTTSSEELQETYRSTGFDPASILRRHLQPQANALLGVRSVLSWPLWLALGLSALALLLTLRPSASSIAAVALALSLGGAGPACGALWFARAWSRDLQQPPSRAVPFVALTAASVLVLALLIALWPTLPPLGAFAFAAWGLTGAGVVARVARSQESPEGLALRRRLLAARQFFAGELGRPEPRIEDDWLPYLIAFDLAGEIDHWYLAFGRIETAALAQRQPQRLDSDISEITRRPSGSGWTGGRGALGGSGASGAWIAATSGLTVASEVPARARPRARSAAA